MTEGSEIVPSPSTSIDPVPILSLGILGKPTILLIVC